MYGSFLENLTATSLEKRCLTTMEVSNQIGGDDSVGKQQVKEPTFDHSSEESTHAYSDDELGKKMEVNSTGSRLCMCRDCRISVLASNLAHNIL